MHPDLHTDLDNLDSERRLRRHLLPHRFWSSHLIRLRTTSKPSANSLSPFTTRGGCSSVPRTKPVESAWPWLPDLRLAMPTVALPIRSTHRRRQSSKQLRATTSSGQRRSGTRLGTVWPGVRNAACRSASRQPLPRHQIATALTLRSSRTALTAPTLMGRNICREGSCSHDQGSDPCPRSLSHVCICCLKPHWLVSCPVRQRRKANRAKRMPHAAATPAALTSPVVARLASCPWIQPLTRAGCLLLEEFIFVCVERSRALLLSLCAEPRRARVGPSHRQPCFDRFGTLRLGERLLSSNEGKETPKQSRMVACAIPTQPLRRTQAFACLASGFVRCWRSWSTIQNFTRPLGSQRFRPPCASRALCESPPSCRVQCRRGGYIPNLWHCLLDFAQDPETDVIEWLHSGVPLGIESAIGTNSLFPEVHGASAAVEACRLCGVACGVRWRPSFHRNYKSLEEASELVKHPN